MGFKEMMRPVPGLKLVGCGEQAPYFWVNCLEDESDDEVFKKVLGKQHIAFTATSMSFKVSSSISLTWNYSKERSFLWYGWKG